MSHRIPCIVLFLFAVLTAGCQQQVKTAYFPITPDDELISTSELAKSLGLKVDHAARGATRLSNSTNTVLLFPAAGETCVNGKTVGPAKEIWVYHGETYVTCRLANTIRSSLSPVSSRPPRPAAPTRPQPYRGKVYGTVLLDAGHGGDDPGAIARTGRREKDVVLAVTLALAQRLRDQGVNVKLTRATDVFVTLDGRVARANRLGADLFVSIHADASQNRSARGATVYVPRREGPHSRSHQAGRAINSALAAGNPEHRGLRVHEKNLRVLERTSGPAVLVELGFLTNPYEERLLASPDYQQRLADALAGAIVDYLKK
jgi:N-acetylmuramoyl-L-alanine amidase